MGLEEVKKEILERAEEQSRSIIRQGKKEAEQIFAETEKQLKEYMEKARDDAKRIIETMERKERASAEFDVKKMGLDKKKETIDRAIDSVKKSIIGMPEKKRETYISKLIEKARKEIEVAYVYANAADKRIIENIKGVKYRPADISGGIIAENDDGSIRVDLSYDETLEAISRENMQEIAARLFS